MHCNRRIILLGLIALTAVAMVSCHGTIREEPPTDTTATATDSLPLPPEEMTPCPYSQLTCSFDCEVHGISANGLLRARCDSVLWLSVSKIIELGRARLTPDSVVVHININGSHFAGTYDDLHRATGYATTFATLQQMIGEAYRDNAPTINIPIPTGENDEMVVVRPRHFDTPTAPLSFPIRRM